MAGSEPQVGFDKVFQRHSRPQLPNLPRTSQESSHIKPPSLVNPNPQPSWVSSLSSAKSSLEKRLGSPRNLPAAKAVVGDFLKLGTLVEGTGELLVYNKREDPASLFMFKLVPSYQKRLLSFNHAHVLAPRFVMSTEAGTLLGYDYVRHTLEDLLSVHRVLEAAHVHVIAASVFEAIRYLHTQGACHGAVSSHAVRICGRSGQVFLGGCEISLGPADAQSATRDLEDLALMLLRAMEAPASRRKQTAKDVRSHLLENRVFGLSNSERWSDSQQLVDCITWLFSSSRPPSEKLSKPHEYFHKAVPAPQILLPMVELASLECFPLWQAAAP